MCKKLKFSKERVPLVSFKEAIEAIGMTMHTKNSNGNAILYTQTKCEELYLYPKLLYTQSTPPNVLTETKEPSLMIIKICTLILFPVMTPYTNTEWK